MARRGLEIAEKRERERKLASWHTWFAWHPVYLDTGELVWFETIERRRIEGSPAGIGDSPYIWCYR